MSRQTTDRLEGTFPGHGLSDKIISDKDPQYSSAHLKKFCTDRENGQTTIAPYSHSNDQTEGFVQSLKVLKNLAIEGNTNKIRLTQYRFTPSYNLS